MRYTEYLDINNKFKGSVVMFYYILSAACLFLLIILLIAFIFEKRKASKKLMDNFTSIKNQINLQSKVIEKIVAENKQLRKKLEI